MNYDPRDRDYFPPSEPIDPPTWQNGHAIVGAAQKRFELIPFDKIKIDTAPSYLIKGIIPRVGLCVFWGPPKCGKSFLVYDMAMHIALGWKYRERKVRQGAVVYCALEGCAAFKNRVEAFRQVRLADNASEVAFHLMASPMALVADHHALIAAIRATIGTIPPAAVVIDTLNRSLAGSESDDRDMAAYVKAADAIRDAFTCAVVIVHHCGHEGTRPRGHSSLIGAVDAQIASSETLPTISLPPSSL
jgi:RecA-family ATPase